MLLISKKKVSGIGYLVITTTARTGKTYRANNKYKAIFLLLIRRRIKSKVVNNLITVDTYDPE